MSHATPPPGGARPQVVVFDVNETLLDLGGVRAALVGAIGPTAPAGEWFARLLHGSLVANHLGRHPSFEDIAADECVRVAHAHGVALDRDLAVATVSTLRSAPAHADVAPALERLRLAGVRLAVLSNGSADMLAGQFAGAGLADFFEMAISADEVGRFKPAPEVYLSAAVRLGVDLDAMLMVAAHDWDVLGARSVGIPGAFVARPRSAWCMPDPLPHLTVPDLGILADRLLA